MFLKPLSKLSKSSWSVLSLALATLGAGAGFFWIMTHPQDLARAIVGVAASALLGALSGWRKRTVIPNLMLLALLLIVFGTGTGALILTEGVLRRILVAIVTVLAGFVIMLGENPGLPKTTIAWISRARRGALVIMVFLLGASAAAFTTYLRLPPSVVGLVSFLPLWVILFADTFFEHRGITARRALGSGVIAILGVEFMVALLALPLTFTAVGVALAVATALLREIAERAVEAGIFTVSFLQRVAAVSLGALILILGTARWS